LYHGSEAVGRGTRWGKRRNRPHPLDRQRDGSAEFEALSGIPDPLMIHMGDTDNTVYRDGWLGKYVLYTRL
jgi:hypothetical protein